MGRPSTYRKVCPLTPHSAYWAGFFFCSGCMRALSMVSGAPRAEILTSQIQCILWQNIFCKFQLWYSLHFQIFEFDTSNIIQILLLVWIIGSIYIHVYIQRRRNFAAKVGMSTGKIYTVTRELSRSAEKE